MSYYKLFKIKDELFKIISHDNEEVYRTLKAMKIDKIAKPLDDKIDDEDVIVVLSDGVFELFDDYYNNRLKELFVVNVDNNKTLLHKKAPETILNKYNLSQTTITKNNILLTTMFNVQNIVEYDDVFKCNKCKKWFRKHNSDGDTQFNRIGLSVVCKKCYKTNKRRKNEFV